jgi:hypothetical protein
LWFSFFLIWICSFSISASKVNIWFMYLYIYAGG